MVADGGGNGQFIYSFVYTNEWGAWNILYMLLMRFRERARQKGCALHEQHSQWWWCVALKFRIFSSVLMTLVHLFCAVCNCYDRILVLVFLSACVLRHTHTHHRIMWRILIFENINFHFGTMWNVRIKFDGEPNMFNVEMTCGVSSIWRISGHRRGNVWCHCKMSYND